MRQAVVDRRERECGRAFDMTALVVEPQVELQMFDLHCAVRRVMFGARNRFTLDVGRRVVKIDLRPLARVEQCRVNEWIVYGHDQRSFGIRPSSCKYFLFSIFHITFVIYHCPSRVVPAMANAKYQMENGKWKMENGKWNERSYFFPVSPSRAAQGRP